MAALQPDEERLVETLPGHQVVGTVDRKGSPGVWVLARSVDVVSESRPCLRWRHQDVWISLIVVLREKGAVKRFGWHDHVWYCTPISLVGSQGFYMKYGHIDVGDVGVDGSGRAVIPCGTSPNGEDDPGQFGERNGSTPSRLPTYDQ